MSHHGDRLPSPTKATAPDPSPRVCTQYQIRYSCGHSLNAVFVKCAAHANNEEVRCRTGQWEYKELRTAPHRCRDCSKSEDWTGISSLR
jgi:hypothetical protein